jgi:hypothetical protein
MSNLGIGGSVGIGAKKKKKQEQATSTPPAGTAGRGGVAAPQAPVNDPTEHYMPGPDKVQAPVFNLPLDLKVGNAAKGYEQVKGRLPSPTKIVQVMGMSAPGDGSVTAWAAFWKATIPPDTMVQSPFQGYVDELTKKAIDANGDGIPDVNAHYTAANEDDLPPSFKSEAVETNDTKDFVNKLLDWGPLTMAQKQIGMRHKAEAHKEGVPYTMDDFAAMTPEEQADFVAMSRGRIGQREYDINSGSPGGAFFKNPMFLDGGPVSSLPVFLGKDAEAVGLAGVPLTALNRQGQVNPDSLVIMQPRNAMESDFDYYKRAYIQGVYMIRALASKDPKVQADAELQLNRAGVIPAGMTAREYMTTVSPDSEETKAAVFLPSLQWRDTRVFPSEELYTAWFAGRHGYGEDWMPTSVVQMNRDRGTWTKELLASFMSFPDEFIQGIGGKQIRDPQTGKVAEASFFHRSDEEMIKLVGFLRSENPAEIESDLSSIHVKTGVMSANGSMTDKSLEEYAKGSYDLNAVLDRVMSAKTYLGDKLGEPIDKAMLLPSVVGNRVVTAAIYFGAKELGDGTPADGDRAWENQKGLMATFAESWEESEGKQAWFEYMGEVLGVDPMKHVNVAFTGQMLAEVGFGMLGDKVIHGVGKLALSSEATRAMLLRGYLQPHINLITDVTDSAALRDIYPALTAEEAVKLAGAKTPQEVWGIVGTHGGLLLGDAALKLDQNPAGFSRSLKQKALNEATSSVEQLNKSMFLNLRDGPIDLTFAGSPDVSIMHHMMHAGVPQRVALDIANKVTDVMAKTGMDEAAKRRAVVEVLNEATTTIRDMHKNMAASDAFQKRVSAKLLKNPEDLPPWLRQKAIKEGVPNLTRLDELYEAVRVMRGGDKDFDPYAPNAGAPGRFYAPGEGGVERSLGIDPGAIPPIRDPSTGALVDTLDSLRGTKAQMTHLERRIERAKARQQLLGGTVDPMLKAPHEYTAFEWAAIERNRLTYGLDEFDDLSQPGGTLTTDTLSKGEYGQGRHSSRTETERARGASKLQFKEVYNGSYFDATGKELPVLEAELRSPTTPDVRTIRGKTGQTVLTGGELRQMSGDVRYDASVVVPQRNSRGEITFDLTKENNAKIVDNPQKAVENGEWVLAEDVFYDYQPFKNTRGNLNHTEVMYRGMSFEELSQLQRDGEFETYGYQNVLAGQGKMLCVADNPEYAFTYANGSALSTSWGPTFERPGYVVEFDRRPYQRVMKDATGRPLDPTKSNNIMGVGDKVYAKDIRGVVEIRLAAEKPTTIEWPGKAAVREGVEPFESGSVGHYDRVYAARLMKEGEVAFDYHTRSVMKAIDEGKTVRKEVIDSLPLPADEKIGLVRKAARKNPDISYMAAGADPGPKPPRVLGRDDLTAALVQEALPGAKVVDLTDDMFRPTFRADLPNGKSIWIEMTGNLEAELQEAGGSYGTGEGRLLGAWSLTDENGRVVLESDGLIMLSKMGIEETGKGPMRVLNHEVFHAVQDFGVLTPEEWGALNIYFKGDREAMAYAYNDWDGISNLPPQTMTAFGKIKSFFANLFLRIFAPDKLAQKVREAKVYQTFDAVKSGAVWERVKAAPPEGSRWASAMVTEVDTKVAIYKGGKLSREENDFGVRVVSTKYSDVSPEGYVPLAADHTFLTPDDAAKFNSHPERHDDWQKIYAAAPRIAAKGSSEAGTLMKFGKGGKIDGVPIIDTTQGCQRSTVLTERVANGVLPQDTLFEGCYGGCWVDDSMAVTFGSSSYYGQIMEYRQLAVANHEDFPSVVANKKFRTAAENKGFVRHGQRGDDSHAFAYNPTGAEGDSIAAAWLQAMQDGGMGDTQNVFISASYAPVTDAQYRRIASFGPKSHIVHFSVSGYFHPNELSIRFGEYLRAKRLGVNAKLRVITNMDNIEVGPAKARRAVPMAQQEALLRMIRKAIKDGDIKPGDVLETPLHNDNIPADSPGHRSRPLMEDGKYVFDGECCVTGLCSDCPVQCLSNGAILRKSTGTIFDDASAVARRFDDGETVQHSTAVKTVAQGFKDRKASAMAAKKKPKKLSEIAEEAGKYKEDKDPKVNKLVNLYLKNQPDLLEPGNPVKTKENVLTALAEEQASWEAEKAAKQAHLDDIKGTLTGITLQANGKPVPETMAQVIKGFNTEFSDTELALFSHGNGDIRWETIQRKMKMDAFNTTVKRVYLFRLATMMTIIGADEGARAILQGINPFKGARGLKHLPGFADYVGPDAAAIIDGSPLLREHIGGLIDQIDRPDYTWAEYGGHNGRYHEQACRQWLATHNAKADPIINDWLTEFDRSMDLQRIRKDGPMLPETPEMVQKAAQSATDKIREKAHNDPAYIGDGTPENPGYLATRDPVGFDPDLREAGIPDLTDDFVTTISSDCARLAMRVDTRRHLREGVAGVHDKDFVKGEVHRAYGTVPLVIDRRPSGLGHTLKHPFVSASDGMFGLLNAMTTHLKRTEFGKFFNEHTKALQKAFPDSDPVWVREKATRMALSEVENLSYLNEKTLFDRRVRNLTMFLPAYRQFWKYWGPKMVKNPMTSYAAITQMEQMPDQTVPEWMPLVGGTKWNPKSVNFFAGLASGEWLKVLPPLAPIITVPMEVASMLGNDSATSLYTTLSGGYKPGAPMMRSIDAMLFGVIGDTGFYPGNWVGAGKALDAPGTEQVMQKRMKQCIAAMVVQAVTSDGKAIDGKKAWQQVKNVELGRGLWTFVVPGQDKVAAPTITINVMRDGKNIGKRTIDLGVLNTAQYEFLNAVNEGEKMVVLAKYPMYAPIAKAWELQGDDQLAYLSKNRWVIPFVSRRRESTGDTESPGILMTQTERQDYQVYMKPEEIAKSMTQRYQEVDKFDLKNRYLEAEKRWKKEYFAKKGMTEMQRKYGLPAAWENYVLPSRQKAWAQKNKAELNRVLTNSNGTPYDLNRRWNDDTKTYAWTESLTASTSYLDPETKKLFDHLADGTQQERYYLQQSPLLPEYLRVKAKEYARARDDTFWYAGQQYKDSLNNRAFEVLGIKVDKRYWDKTVGALGIRDKFGAKLDAETFGTTKWIKLYGEQKKALAQYQNDPNLKGVYKGTAWLLLHSPNGPTTVQMPEGIMQPQNKQTQRYTAAVRKVMLNPSVPFEKVAELRKKTKGDARLYFDAAVAAVTWEFILKESMKYRNKLKQAYSDAPNWDKIKGVSIDSKVGQKTLKQWKWFVHQTMMMDNIIGGSWTKEWNLYNGKSNGYLLQNLIDPSI